MRVSFEGIPRSSSNGPANSFDELHLLDTVALAAENQILVYYKAHDNQSNQSTGAAVSSDGGNTFRKINNGPVYYRGPSDVFFHNGTYYHYHAHYQPTSGILQMALSTSTEPDEIGRNQGVVVPVGSSGQYDAKSVFGGKIFRVGGDSRWFMLYQLSARHTDFPERFHVAFSYDLKKWTKVKNSLPFMVRGHAGEWDQGGIWTSDIFAHKGILYLYYEGWGSFSDDSKKRNESYYSGGRSRLGAASVSVVDFLDWVNGQGDMKAPTYKLVNVNSHKTLDIEGLGTVNGTPLLQWDSRPNNHSSQKFSFTLNSDGSFNISPGNSRKCLDVIGYSQDNHAKVHLWNCHGGANQKWLIQKIHKHQYEIRNKHSDKCLEIIGGQTVSGVRAIQYNCTKEANQRWRMIQLNE